LGNTTGATALSLQSGTGGIAVTGVLAATSNSASLCRDTSTGKLTSCDSSNTTGRPYLQGGNSFGVAGDLGTNDNFALNFRTNGTTKLTVTTGGDLQLAQGANRTLSVAANTTANGAGYNFTLAAGAANGSTTGNTGGTLVLTGGAAAGSGNNNGGNITIDGGARTGSGSKGYVVLQGTGGNVGIGVTTPGYQLDMRGSTASQIHLSSDSLDQGAYLLGTATGTYIGGNSYFDGTNFIAKSTTAQVMTVDGISGLGFYANSGLTVGNVYTVTPRFAVTTAGIISAYNNLNFKQASTIGTDAATTANAGGYALTMQAGTANGSTTGNVGGALSLQGGNAAGTGNNNGGAVSIAGGTATGTGATGGVNIQTGSGSVTIGNGTGAAAVTINTGTGGVNIASNGVANTVQIGNTSGAVAQTINIGNNATASSTSTVVIGSTIGSSGVTLQAGSGNIVANASTFQFSSGGSRTITIASQPTSNTAGDAMTIQGAAGNGTGVGGNVTIQAGTGGVTNANGGTLFLKGGTRGAAGGTDGGVIVRPTNDNTAVFQIQKADNTALLVADTSNMVIKVGNGVTTSITPVLATTTAEINTRILIGSTINGIDFNTGAGANSYFRLTGNARNIKKITLSPEYAGATVTGDGTNNIGTMTSDFCSGTSRLSINTTVCGATVELNYYSWTAQGTNVYDIYIRYQLPSDFDGWASNSSIQMYGWRSTSNEKVELTVFNSSGGTCGSTTELNSSNTTWQLTALTGSETSDTNCNTTNMAPGSVIIFRIRLTVGSNNNFARAGSIVFDYLSKF
jgi:hypothetical protein